MSFQEAHIKSLSKKQRIGTIVMLVLLASFHIYNFFLYPIIYRLNDTFSIYELYVNLDNSQTLINSGVLKAKPNNLMVNTVEHDTLKIHAFDPNSIDSIKLVSFNLPGNITRNWINYRKKGGRFYKCTELKKIYGMDPVTLDSLLIFCKCPPFPRNRNGNFKTNHANNRKTKSKQNISSTLVNINTADSLALTSLRGVGPVLSKRIVKYRSRLGGFHQLNQLVEVYGIEDSVLNLNQSMLMVDGPINRININNCEYRELIRHFYFDKSVTNAILKYRKQHGDFDSIQQLKNIRIINDSIYAKINSYLEI